MKHSIIDWGGKGRVQKYKPWLRIQAVPTNGLKRTVACYPISGNRAIHVLAKLETSAFLIPEWKPNDPQEE
jgi:hypothetical protein